MEQLDQEITLQLQKIDSNLNHCFAKISREIIPCVEKYGSVCDEIVDNVSYMGGLFRGTGEVTLQGQENIMGESQIGGTAAASSANSSGGVAAETGEASEGGGTGIDAEMDTLETNSTNDSTRQRRKRKVSLLLQQEYGSSSPRDEEAGDEDEGTLPSVAVLKFNTGADGAGLERMS